MTIDSGLTETPYTSKLLSPVEGTPSWAEDTWTGISLDSPVEEVPQEGISLDVQPNASKDPEVAKQRAFKAHIALGDQSPGVSQLEASFFTGNEDSVRNTAALTEQEKRVATKLEVVKELSNSNDLENLQKVAQHQISVSPDVALEEAYAHAVMSNAIQLSNKEGSTLRREIQENPEKLLASASMGARITARKELMQKIQEDAEDRYKDQSTFGAIVDFAKTVVPFYSNYKFHNLVKMPASGSIIPGQNRADQYNYILGLEPEESYKVAKAAVEALGKDNPSLAIEFAHGLTDYSSQAQTVDMLFAGMDAATVAPVKTVGRLLGGIRRGKAGEVLEEVKKAATGQPGASAGTPAETGLIRDVTEAAVQAKPTVPEMVAATGDVQKAAEATVLRDAALKAKDPFDKLKDLRQDLMGIFRVDQVSRDFRDISRTYADRLTLYLESNSNKLIHALEQHGTVDRAPTEAYMKAIEQAKVDMPRMYNGANDSVIGFKWSLPEKDLTNVATVEMQLGKPSAVLFDTKAQAHYYAKNVYKIPDEITNHTGAVQQGWKVGEQGGKYFIRVEHTVDETSPAFRQAVLATENTTPASPVNTFLGSLRGAADLVSPFQMDQRNITAHAQSILQKAIQEVAKPIGRLSKDSIRDLETILAHNRDTPRDVLVGFGENAKTIQKRGFYYDSISELQQGYKSLVGRLPTDKEVEAYFTARQLNDFHYLITNLSTYRDYARLGLRDIQLSYREPARETELGSFGGKQRTTGAFKGKIIDSVPYGDGVNGNIYIHSDVPGASRLVSKESLTQAERDAIQESIQKGEKKLVQVADQQFKPLEKVTGSQEPVHFVLSENITHAPLSWKQVEYSPGGHVEYMFDNWVKQGNIRRVFRDGEEGMANAKPIRHVYEGDRVAFNFASAKEAQEVAGKMETARILLRDGKYQELENFLPSNLPHSRKDFENLFRSIDGEPPQFSLHDSFVHTSEGKNVFDAHPQMASQYEGFENSIRHPYNLMQGVDKKFRGARDLPAYTMKTREGDTPAFDFAPARNISPLSTLTTSMQDVMRGRLMEDYKLSAIEQWMAQSQHLLKGVSEAELKANPMYYLRNPVWDETALNRAELAAAKNSRRAVLDFIGNESPFQLQMSTLREGLMNMAYSKLSPKRFEAVSEHLLSTVPNPFDLLKQMAFHTKLGAWNPIQYVLQIQTLSNIAGVAGFEKASQGFRMGTLMQYLGRNEMPETVAGFGNIAAKAGVKKEWFLESLAEMRKTGLYNIEGEHAFRADAMNPKAFQSKIGAIADSSPWFFNQGERLTRLVSWNTAYMEWREANPLKVMTNADRNRILSRQNDLSVNMTRAGNASWQSGWTSVPTQFLAYPARMAEMLFPFLSNRLTSGEKVRATATNMALYGIPAGVGATIGVWPITESLRTEALKKGVDMDNPAIHLGFQGLLGTAVDYLTGTNWNYSERMGPGGSKFFRDMDIFGGDKGLSETLFGPSGSIFAQWVKDASPIGRWVIDAFNNQTNEGFPIKSSDFLDVARDIASVNLGVKAIVAFNIGSFMTKNETVQDSATPFQAIFAGLTGLTPAAISDLQLMKDSMKDLKEAQDTFTKLIGVNYKRLQRAVNENNPTEAQDYAKRIKVYLIAGGFRPDQLAEVMSRAVGSTLTDVQKTNLDFIKNAPVGEGDARQKAFAKKLEERNKK